MILTALSDECYLSEESNRIDNLCALIKFTGYFMCICFKHQKQTQHTTSKMLQTTSFLLVALVFATNGQQQRQVLYSRLMNEVTDFSLAVLYEVEVRFSQCAELCFEDDYCAEFLYSETSRQCFGLHYVNKVSYSYQIVVSPSTQMLHYKRGKLYFINAQKVHIQF